MAQKLGFWNQYFFGNFAEREAINRNAEDLSAVETDLGELRKIVQRQAQEILRLRAMFMGLIDVVQLKTGLDDKDLEHAVEAAWAQVSPPPPQPKQSATDPYRSMPGGEPSPEEIEAAKALLATAQDHHFSRRFEEAKSIYQQIVERHGSTKQAAVARQQLDNLKR